MYPRTELDYETVQRDNSNYSTEYNAEPCNFEWKFLLNATKILKRIKVSDWNQGSTYWKSDRHLQEKVISNIANKVFISLV